MPQREQMKISLPPDLVQWLDEARGDLSRSRFVESVLHESMSDKRVKNLGLFSRTEKACDAMTVAGADPATLCGICSRPLGEHRVLGT